MTAQVGPASLPQLEDRVLFELVALTGDRPMGVGEGVSEADLAVPLAKELDISPDFPSSSDFHHSEARMTILAAVEALEDEGVIEAHKVFGPWTIRPTRNGRRKVAQWRDEWERRQQALDQKVQRRILEKLEKQRRSNPSRYTLISHLDWDELSAELDVERDVCLANAHRLLDQRRIAEPDTDQLGIAVGQVYITEAGIQALNVGRAAERPLREAQEAWVEVARLRRRLQIAERTLPSLIQDKELRRRCEDLLVAEGHYDRVIREACVILENRVRQAVGASSNMVGTALMETAFSPKHGPVRLSDVEQEQLGAMQFYRGVMAFFRNAAGHKVIETYSQEDALRFVAWIDLLLTMVRDADNKHTLGTVSTGHVDV